MGDWAPFIAVLAVLTSLASLAMNFINSGATKIEELRKEHLSLREHDEFKRSLETRLAGVDRVLDTKAPTKRVKEYKKDLLRDLRHLARRLELIETTRPTTGELQGAASGIKEQVLALERRIEETARAAALQRAQTASTLEHAAGKNESSVR
jgi:hypothetical protein